MTDHSYQWLHVIGNPVAQGSMKGFPIRRGNRMGVSITHSNEKSLKPWRAKIAASAHQQDIEMIESGGVAVAILIRIGRPDGHLGTGRNAGSLKRSAPTRPTVKPDLDKLIRSVGDALTGRAWKDDSQIVLSVNVKEYADPAESPGVDVLITPVIPEESLNGIITRIEEEVRQKRSRDIRGSVRQSVSREGARPDQSHDRPRRNEPRSGGQSLLWREVRRGHDRRPKRAGR